MLLFRTAALGRAKSTHAAMQMSVRSHLRQPRASVVAAAESSAGVPRELGQRTQGTVVIVARREARLKRHN